MSQHAYRAPSAELERAETPTPRPVRGVILGLLVDYAATATVGAIAVMGYTMARTADGLTPAEITFELQGLVEGSSVSLLRLALIVAGALCSVAGGYVCGRVSRSPSLVPPRITAALAVAASLWTTPDLDGLPIWLAGQVLGVTCILLGGAWGRARYARPEPVEQPTGAA